MHEYKSDFFNSSDEKAEPVLSSEHIRALSILTYSDNAELQRSAALCMLEISERCKYVLSHVYYFGKTLLHIWKIFLFPGSRKVSWVLVAFGWFSDVFTLRYACLFWILVILTNSLEKNSMCTGTLTFKCLSFKILRQIFPWRGFSWFNYHSSICIQVHVYNFQVNGQDIHKIPKFRYSL